MDTQMIFKRHEVKYLITEEQYDILRDIMAPYMNPDIYGRTTNYSLYFDTPDFLIARRSAERPAYKEKFRVRSYGTVTHDDPVFLELKKKYKGITYKRRVEMTEGEAFGYLKTGTCSHPSQITREIDYFRGLYPDLEPRMLISYDREAFYDKIDPGFRMTFDRNILWRESDLDLQTGSYGKPLLKRGQVLMELKAAYAFPLWLSAALTENRIRRTSFSKYVNACREQFAAGRKVIVMYQPDYNRNPDIKQPVIRRRSSVI